MILLGILITPSINAAILKEIEEIEDNEESTCLGVIDGFTSYITAFHTEPLPFTLVEVKGDLLYRRDRSNIISYFRIAGLPLGKTYNVTASKRGFNSETKTAILTSDEPKVRLFLTLRENDDSIISNNINKLNVNRAGNNEEPACLGSIYGHTGEGYIWGFSPVRFAKVQAGGRTTISGPIMGEYKIRGLPLGTYTVTGSKPGYITYITTVTLTERYPDKQVFIDLQPNEDSVNKAITQVKNEETEYVGKIYGYTQCSHGVWTWDPIPNAMVRTGFKITRSDDEGYYEITGLPIDRTYRVVANRFGYLRTVEKVTLTAEKPEVELYIDMMWIIDFIFSFL